MGFTRDIPFITPDGSPSPQLRDADSVVYLAGSITPSTAEQDPAAVAKDLRLLDTFIDCLHRLDHPLLVILPTSGGTVYDPAGQPPYSEKAPTLPAAVYGRTKLEMERRLISGTADWGRTMALRISNVFGPGQRLDRAQGVVVHWMAAALRGEPLRIFGDPAATRDYVYVDDVVRAMMLVLESDPMVNQPSVLNIGSGVPTALGELADLVAEVVGGADIAQEPSRSFDVHDTWLDIRLAQEVMGWTPVVQLDEGLRRTWDHVRTTMGSRSGLPGHQRR